MSDEILSSTNQFGNNYLDIIDNCGSGIYSTTPSFSLVSPYSRNCDFMESPNGDAGKGKELDLQPITDIPEPYRDIFSCYPSFNAMQSKVINDVLHSDDSVVIAAPTGSGKTVIFEVSIIWLLMKIEETRFSGNFKIVYMAPIKALCRERYQDWVLKFSYLGLKCQEITGDTEPSDLSQLLDFHILFTTPEKWDSLTRKWKDNRTIVQFVKLFLIDEVHILNEEIRGPIIEAVVSRMKTIQDNLSFLNYERNTEKQLFPVRFIAVSATLPNIEDIASWLGEPKKPAKHLKVGDEYRPVKLQKVVLGYSCPHHYSPFRFDIMLSYKLQPLLLKYADGKPTLIFCSTRKGVNQTAETLRNQITFHFNVHQKEQIMQAVTNIKENKLKEHVISGVGYHHAGMDINDRQIIEQLFRSCSLPVLVATSTLAVGVNLPAHLVIVKSTQHYVGGMYVNYSDSQVLQMIGRAGRPQYDKHATAVIMTRENEKVHYEKLIEGKDVIESNLHRHLTEHINSEVVLNTITDMAVAMSWIRSTFLYVRALKNPCHYGIPAGISKKGIENKLQEICQRELNALANAKLVEVDILEVRPTDMGRLMAQYYMGFETMKSFSTIKGNETLSQLLLIIASCSEFSGFQLRTSDKKQLNLINKSGLRYPIKGLIKTKEMKVNCLIQAAFGCLTIQDPSLHQELLRIMRIGQRTSKCLVQYMKLKPYYQGLVSALILAKCFHCKLWENSPYVSRQFEKIGPVLSELLVTTGKRSIKDISSANPRDLERILNRPPPMGNILQEAASHLPEYHVTVNAMKCNSGFKIVLNLSIKNSELVNENNTAGKNHGPYIIVGDSKNKLHLLQKFRDQVIIINNNRKKWILEMNADVSEVKVNIISEEWVGLDENKSIKLPPGMTHITEKPMETLKDKKQRTESIEQQQNLKRPSQNLLENLKTFSEKIQETFGVKRLCLQTPISKHLEKFQYTPLKNNNLPPLYNLKSLPQFPLIQKYTNENIVYFDKHHSNDSSRQEKIKCKNKKETLPLENFHKDFTNNTVGTYCLRNVSVDFVDTEDNHFLIRRSNLNEKSNFMIQSRVVGCNLITSKKNEDIKLHQRIENRLQKITTPSTTVVGHITTECSMPNPKQNTSNQTESQEMLTFSKTEKMCSVPVTSIMRNELRTTPNIQQFTEIKFDLGIDQILRDDSF